MSETRTNGINVPPEQDFDTMGFQGSMQQVLQENIGTFVNIEFLIGSNNLVSRAGYLYAVGSQFVVLYNAVYQQWVVCDIFSVKFVSFLQPAQSALDDLTEALQQLSEGPAGNETQSAPGSVNTAEPNRVPAQTAPATAAATMAAMAATTAATAAATSASAASRTPSQAAYTYAARRAPVPQGRV